MAVQTADVLSRAAQILADVDGVRWTPAELTNWARDAVRQIVLARPDAYSVVREFTLKAGSSLQTVGNVASDDNKAVGAMTSGPAIRLLRVTRNAGTGRPVREAGRIALDSEVPDWHAPVSMANWMGVEHYVFDNIAPYSFYVYPCPPAGLATHKIEIVYAAMPPLTSASLGLADHYINPILDWVLYRALSKDSEYAGNMARAVSHRDTFAQALSLTGQAEFQAASPALASPTPAGVGR